MKKFIAGIIATVGAITLFEALRRKGVVDQVGGKFKESFGEASGDLKMQAEGVYDQAKGKTKEFVSDVKSSVSNSMDGSKG